MMINPVFPIARVQEALGTFNLDTYRIQSQDTNAKIATLQHEILPYKLEIKAPRFAEPRTNPGAKRVAEGENSPNMILYDNKGNLERIPGMSKDYFLSQPTIFSLEKSFRATRGQNRINGWKQASPEHNEKEALEEILGLVNQNPYMFTSGWCHSGKPADTNYNPELSKEGFFIFKADTSKESIQALTNYLRGIEQVVVKSESFLSPQAFGSYPALVDPKSGYNNLICRILPTATTTEEINEQYDLAWDKIRYGVGLYLESAQNEHFNETRR